MLELFTISDVTIYLHSLSFYVIIRNNTYNYTMLLSDVGNVDHIRQCVHKRWYIVLNVHKLSGSINILLPPKNVSSGLLGACNNCRTTWNHISLIFKWTVTEKLVMALHIFHVYSSEYSLDILTIPQFIYRKEKFFEKMKNADIVR